MNALEKYVSKQALIEKLAAPSWIKRDMRKFPLGWGEYTEAENKRIDKFLAGRDSARNIAISQKEVARGGVKGRLARLAVEVQKTDARGGVAKRVANRLRREGVLPLVGEKHAPAVKKYVRAAKEIPNATGNTLKKIVAKDRRRQLLAARKVLKKIITKGRA